MINLMPTIPPDLPVTLQTLSDALALLSNPEAAKARVAELRDAVESSKTERANFVAAFSKASADQAAHQEALDAATAEHAAKLAADQAAFDTACAARKSALDDREATLSQLQAKAQADADAAAAARADYDHRLALIKTATA